MQMLLVWQNSDDSKIIIKSRLLCTYLVCIIELLRWPRRDLQNVPSFKCFNPLSWLLCLHVCRLFSIGESSPPDLRGFFRNFLFSRETRTSSPPCAVLSLLTSTPNINQEELYKQEGISNFINSTYNEYWNIKMKILPSLLASTTLAQSNRERK